MTLLEIAQIYTDLVLLENQIPEGEGVSKEETNVLRSKYHQMFMDKLREENVEFSDRFEAMNIAFELIKSHSKSVQRAGRTTTRP